MDDFETELVAAKLCFIVKGSRRPRSRPSSVSSLRSRTSSIESLSDIGVNGFQSDASEGKVW